MTRQEYCDRVLGQLHRVTARERAAIRAEIDGHIEDHMAALLDRGYDWDLASQRTMNAMGDPEEVGRALEQQYPLRWLILSRVALAALVAVCVVVLLSGPSLYGVRMNLRARFDPMSFADTERAVERGLTVTEADIRIPMGDDIWYIYGSGTGGRGDKGVATVLVCWYDKNPFGYAEYNNDTLRVTDCRGAEADQRGGSSFISSGVTTRRLDVAVQRGDPYVTVSCQRFGQVYEAQVTLCWEEMP